MNNLLIGKSVRCTVCDLSKKPRGRSAPLESIYCDDECEGYRLAPSPGDLWHGERREDFGYPSELAQVAMRLSALEAMLARTADMLSAIVSGNSGNVVNLANEARELLGAGK